MATDQGARYPSVEAVPTQSEVASAYRTAQSLVRRLGILRA